MLMNITLRPVPDNSLLGCRPNRLRLKTRLADATSGREGRIQLAGARSSCPVVLPGRPMVMTGSDPVEMRQILMRPEAADMGPGVDALPGQVAERESRDAAPGSAQDQAD